MDERIKVRDQLELVREALKAYDDGELQELAALVAIQMCVSNCTPSKEAIEWAKNSIMENYIE